MSIKNLNLKKYIIGPNTPIETTKGFIPRVYFNNSATTLILKPAMKKFFNLLPIYTYINVPPSNSKYITTMYEETRNVILEMVGADANRDVAIFTKNSTEAMNVLADVYLEADPEQVVLSTTMEHLANYLPYKARMQTELIAIGKNGNIDLEDYVLKLEKYQGKVKLVAVTGASNITGVVPPYYEMARLAHQYGAKIFVDIVQVIQHLPFTMKPHGYDEHIDFVAFSAHKAYSGLDGGALVGPYDVLEKYLPLDFGSGITQFIDSSKIIYDNPPQKYETGYPDVLGVITMSKALQFLKKVGLDNIAKYERKLYKYLLYRMEEVPDITIYDSHSPFVHIPYISFSLKGIHFKTVAAKLGLDHGIEIGNGTLGADLYVQFLLGLSNEEAYECYKSGMGYGVNRVSLGMYNTFEEIDVFIHALKEIALSTR
ncbi:aminotransferase class V-fold PLP-dependent enzyme [Vallitalea pronyensis]|uniref:Aminotransferase class V-fold PLP-dependent enzyme n=1 Tax=Vallitalea pronyensis TaxID=1348613 RepID=A0A8J8MKW7_9FIRM|nr:aminotransferase class V-fold PLP-dependent enzyme [Vallitalea pronyensis]QUI23178.1 aminotransferase class V-fold PLP-dependent enzyme [Vallitalea pronyensis]